MGLNLGVGIDFLMTTKDNTFTLWAQLAPAWTFMSVTGPVPQFAPVAQLDAEDGLRCEGTVVMEDDRGKGLCCCSCSCRR